LILISAGFRGVVRGEFDLCDRLLGRDLNHRLQWSRFGGRSTTHVSPTQMAEILITGSSGAGFQFVIAQSNGADQPAN